MSTPEIDRAYALIQGLQTSDPKLSEALKIIVKNLGSLFEENGAVREALQPLVSTISAPTGLTATLEFRSIQLSWNAVAGALFYEVRLGDFDDWENATYVTRVTNTTVELPPRLLVGTYTLLVKSFNTASQESTNWAYTTITISPIPTLSLTAQVIDNNVLLDWTEPNHPFEIIRYTISRDGVDIGYVSASFFVYFENSSGEYVYGVRATDIAGNVSAEATIQARVNQPPDFILEDEYLSDLSGTKSNCKIENSTLVAMVDITETWEDHFVNNSWNSIQDQINAGYPYYAQPNLNTGYYEEIHDFTTLFASVLISIEFQISLVSDTVLVQPKLSYSDDGISYSTYEDAFTVFAASVRYVKFKLQFTGADEDDLAEISNIRVKIQVKRVMDSGTVSVLAADVGGTVVTFNVAYRDVDSITLTPLSTTEQIAIYDFVDAPDPTDFKILLLDTAGNRIDGDVSWKARGVI